MMRRISQLWNYAIHYAQLVLAHVVVYIVRRDLLNKNIWLIREKRDEARDNGYHFFKYLRENYPEIEAFYVITEDSPDRFKVEKYGNVIRADSWLHCIYFIAARYSINSQPYGAYPFRFSLRLLNYARHLCNKKQKVVFLQHGITKDFHSLDAWTHNLCNIDYFVTSVPREYEFVKETYKYPGHAIGCVGMARLDNLHAPHIVEDKILVMPTWRKWLGGSITDEKRFLESDYFKAYSELLQDQSLIQYLRAHGYKLVYYMHYGMQPFTKLFRAYENDVVKIADKEHSDVQELLMSSKMMITDYSSVYFDFAYMNKPIAYYQFDKSAFRSSHYAEGYFSYEKDGFGPCFEEWEPLKQYVMDMVLNQCIQSDEYARRVNAFFPVRDCNNCKRTYEAIKSLENTY